MLSTAIASERSCSYIFLFVVFVCFFLNVTSAAFAHPEDDFCGPDSGIDPLLCEQLSELNSGEGDISHPLLDEDGKALSPLNAAIHFTRIGVHHILPGGLDHILFVLILFLGATSLRNLVLQITVFTVAHTATLGFTVVGLIDPPASIVEPLIAVSIVVVAIETFFKIDYVKWRMVVIFGFGLFHGMGFAGFIQDIGLPPNQFWPSLIGFNVGVEIGQLTVVLAAALLFWPLKYVLLRIRLSYHAVAVAPASLLIAFIGLWWFVERSLEHVSF